MKGIARASSLCLLLQPHCYRHQRFHNSERFFLIPVKQKHCTWVLIYAGKMIDDATATRWIYVTGNTQASTIW